jgi:uridine kinase
MIVMKDTENSDAFEDLIGPVLADNFELQVAQLSNVQAAQYLTKAIQDLLGEGMKVVSIIGGPASGKGKLVNILIDQLKQVSLKADSMGTDDYSLGTRQWRWEREREDPLRLKNFNLLNNYIKKIKNLKEGETVAVPTYDPASGLAIAAGEENYTHKIGKSDVLFVEGDFDGVEKPDLMIFIDVPAETRLQVRVDRDLAERGESDSQKVAGSFRSRHEKQYVPHTVPAVKKARFVLRVTPTPNAWLYDIYRSLNNK